MSPIKPKLCASIETYCCDFVVVGTGSAGAVITERLSSTGKFKVIALEAGQDEDTNPLVVGPNPAITVPNTGAIGLDFYWQGITLPDPGANNRTFNWTNGRVLGGGSTVNGQIYNRGSVQRFNQWAEVVGPTWSANNAYAAYKAMENYYGTDTCNTHGTTGLMAINAPIPNGSTTGDFMQAITNGISPTVPPVPIITDYNCPETNVGAFTTWQLWEFSNGTRASSSRTYLNPSIVDSEGNGVNGRKIKILTQTLATKIYWSKKNPTKAKGVYAISKGKPILVIAKKGVIIAAGFNNAALLQVNGIGPSSVLQNAGVPIKINSPQVGQNLVLNYFIPTFLIPPPGFTTNTIPGCYYSGGAFLNDPSGQRNIELSGILLNEGTPTEPFYLSFIVAESPLLPKSTGTIKIQDADPTKIAQAQLNMLSNPADMDTTVFVFQNYVLPMRSYLVNNLGYSYLPPGPTDPIPSDTVGLQEYIANSVSNGHHYQSFTRMGTNISNGVVDVYGKVFGADNLYVVGTSIAPIAIDGNPNGIAEMMAWVIGNHILQIN